MTQSQKPEPKRQHQEPSSPSSDAARTAHSRNIIVGLNAVIITIQEETPYVLVVRHTEAADTDSRTDNTASYGLPFGPFDPIQHRTLEIGLRRWVEEQTYLSLGYVEQLYTFGDRDRADMGLARQARIISIGYLALTRDAPKLRARDNVWHDWYHYFPWEDWRDAAPALIDSTIRPALHRWAEDAPTALQRTSRHDRARSCFGFGQFPWDEEKVLERYELLYEAGLVTEAWRDRDLPVQGPQLGAPMMFDHRRILATGMGRLRAKMKYRPVVFELMPPTFTLLHLQRSVEALAGVRLHKQNFRRLVEKEGLVEGTGVFTTKTGGRPAEQFRFRSEVMSERPAPGFRAPSRLRV